MISLIPEPKCSIVEKVETPEMTKGGLYIPKTVEEKTCTYGKVLATRSEFLPKDLPEDEYVLAYFSRYAGIQIETPDGDKYLAVKDEDILAHEIYKRVKKEVH